MSPHIGASLICGHMVKCCHMSPHVGMRTRRDAATCCIYFLDGKRYMCRGFALCPCLYRSIFVYMYIRYPSVSHPVSFCNQLHLFDIYFRVLKYLLRWTLIRSPLLCVRVVHKPRMRHWHKLLLLLYIYI